MSVTIRGVFKRCFSNSKGTHFLALIKEKHMQHASQPHGKPYYFWDKELTYLEKPQAVKLTFEYGDELDTINRKKGY